jgi:hypothetical protein
MVQLAASPEMLNDMVEKVDKEVMACPGPTMCTAISGPGRRPIGDAPPEMASLLVGERSLWAGVIARARLKAPH